MFVLRRRVLTGYDEMQIRELFRQLCRRSYEVFMAFKLVDFTDGSYQPAGFGKPKLTAQSDSIELLPHLGKSLNINPVWDSDNAIDRKELLFPKPARHCLGNSDHTRHIGESDGVKPAEGEHDMAGNY